MKLRFNGIKGRAGEHDLGRVCLLLGENESGKSTIINALHFALAGKEPALRLGKDEAQDAGKLLKIVSDGGWAELDYGGGKVARWLEATARKARIKIVCDGDEGPAAEARAAELAIDMVFADFRRLLAAGDKERAALLAQYLPQPTDADKRRWLLGNGLSAVAEGLRPAKRGKKEPEPTACTAACVTAEVIGHEEQRVATLAQAHECLPLVHDLVMALRGQVAAGGQAPATAEDVLETLRDAANTAQKAKTEGAAAAKAAAGQTGGDQALAAQVPALEAQVNALRAQAADATKAAAQETARQTRLTQVRSAGRGAVTEQRRIGAAYGKEPTAQHPLTLAVTTATAKVKELTERQPVAPTGADLAALTTRYQQALAAAQTEQAAAKIRRDLLGTYPDEAALLAALDLALKQAQTTQAAHEARKPTPPDESTGLVYGGRTPETIKAVGAPLRATYEGAKAGTCPLLAEPCDRLTGAVPRLHAELAALRTELAESQRAQETMAKCAQARAAEAAAYQAELQRWNDARGPLTVAVEQAVKSRREAATSLARYPDRSAQLATVEAELTAAKRELELAQQTQGEYATALTTWQAAVKTAETAEAAAKAAYETMRTDLARLPGLATHIAELTAELHALEAQAPAAVPEGDPTAALTRIEEALTAAHAAQARITVLAGLDVDELELRAKLWKAAYTGARVGLTSCIQAAIAPVQTKITQALTTMGLPGKFSADLTTMEIGLDVDGTYRSVDALCGSELVRFAVALLSAVPARSGLRVLTVEGVECSPTRLTRLLAGIDLAAFDLVVIATWVHPTAIPAGWTVIDLDTPATGKAVTA